MGAQQVKRVVNRWLVTPYYPGVQGSEQQVQQALGNPGGRFGEK